MFHSTTYAKSTNAPALVPGQLPSSSTTNTEEVNAFNGVPPFNVELQGEPYDQPSSVLKFATQALASHVQNSFPHPMPISLVPGNPNQIYGDAQLGENIPNSAASSPIYWQNGSQPPIPYEQPKQAHYHNEKPGEAGISFAGSLPNATPVRIPPPPPDVRSTPNDQGVFDHAWQLSNARVVPQNHEDLLLIIEMKKVGRSA